MEQLIGSILAKLLIPKKVLPILLSLIKAEFLTPLGLANLIFAAVLAYLTYSLKGDTFSESALDWATDANVGGWVLLPLVVSILLTAILFVLSLVLLYMEKILGRGRGQT